MQRFRAFMRSWWYLDELSFRRPFRSGSVQFSNSCRTTGGDPRASSPTRRFPKERVASSAPPALRPALVDLALAMVAGWRHSLHIVRPDTVIAWHRRAFAGYWTRKSRRRQGRPNMAADIRHLIRDMSQANPLWGAPRIHGELLKLGIEVALPGDRPPQPGLDDAADPGSVSQGPRVPISSARPRCDLRW
jgi:hypothetical protein